MAKNPYIKFYIGDYIKDTRILPLNARGGWAELILQMWNSDPQGELVGTMEEFARVMCCSLEEATFCVNLLKEKKIFSYEDKGEGKMKIISRKQKKMLEISNTRKEAGSVGGNPKLSQNYNKPGYLYAMQRPSDGWVKLGISTNPDKRIYKIRNQLNEPEIELLGSLFVQDMGTEEARIHEVFISKKKGEWFNLDDSEIKKVKILLKVNNISPYGESEIPLKENPEYEYENRGKVEDSKGGAGEKKEEGKGWRQFPGEAERALSLPSDKAQSSLELLVMAGQSAKPEHVEKLWWVFKNQHFDGVKFYQSESEVFKHFVNWSKTQKINGTSAKGFNQNQPVPGIVTERNTRGF